jgi:hypothetical protein
MKASRWNPTIFLSLKKQLSQMLFYEQVVIGLSVTIVLDKEMVFVAAISGEQVRVRFQERSKKFNRVPMHTMATLHTNLDIVHASCGGATGIVASSKLSPKVTWEQYGPGDQKGNVKRESMMPMAILFTGLLWDITILDV